MAENIFYAVLAGGALGLLFDFLRLPRLIFNDKFFFDFLFWIISAFTVFCYLLIFNSGGIRMIYLFFILVGFLLVLFTLGYVTKPLHMAIAEKLKKWSKSLKKVLQKLYNIYYNKKANVKSFVKKKSKCGRNGKAGRKEK
ncbi:MAG: spore cortex biosynthesis protein YabQ [Eubacterium sp.]|nr:spore cortex biosynthesis protein YabQ [Eubacterium sp.]